MALFAPYRAFVALGVVQWLGGVLWLYGAYTASGGVLGFRAVLWGWCRQVWDF